MCRCASLQRASVISSMTQFPPSEGKEDTWERQLPHSAEAERAVLGAIIIDNSLINEAIELLRVEDFYVRAHQLVFRAMLVLSESGQEINPILLGEEMRRASVLETAGGATFLNSLTYGLPHFASIEAYARLIRGKAVRRATSSS
jgi:replicative DNA helicase